MENKITNQDLQEFLNDHYQNSKTTILEEGKEKDDLYKIAEAKGINVKGSLDLAVFKNIYAFADKANKNGARLPKQALLKALPGIVGKPVNMEHNRKHVVGFYIDYSYKQKNEEVVAYGILFKSNFPDEFEQIQSAFKAGKLNTSYEIWCPRADRKLLDDGTYELNKQEIAGGAILIKNEPAFDGAKVLDLAKKVEAYKIDGFDLEYSSKYTDEDLLTAEAINTLPTPIVKINVSSFEMKCPICQMKNWETETETVEEAKVKCLSCGKQYQVQFGEAKKINLPDGIDLFYEGAVNCYQCNHPIHFSQFVKPNEKIDRKIRCPLCGLEFPYAICKKEIKTVKSINIIKEEPMQEPIKEEANDKVETVSEPILEVKPEVIAEDIKPIEAAVIVEPTVIEVPVEVAPVIVEPVAEPIVEPVIAEVPVVVEQPIVEPVKEIVKIEIAKEKYVKMLKKCAKKIKDMKKTMKQVCLSKAQNEDLKQKALINVAEKVSSSKGIVEGYEVELAQAKEQIQILINEKKVEVESAKSFYMDKAKEVFKRRNELGTFADSLDDKQILDEKDYKIAQLEMEKSELTKQSIVTSSVVVGDKDRQKDNGLEPMYQETRKKADELIQFNQFYKNKTKKINIKK
jgi:hypothetical protein